MTPAALLRDLLSRSAEGAEAALEGLGADELTWRPGPDANPVGWLVWHLARVQDDHVAAVAGLEQRWTAEGYADRFGLPYDPTDIGFGHTSEQVGAFRADGALIADYLRSVAASTARWVDGVAEADLDRVVDERWDPPVTLGVRLASVADECSAHVGQAAYVRGLLGR